MSINRLGIVTDAAPARAPRHSSAEKKLAETIINDKTINVSMREAPIIGVTDKDGAVYAGGDTKILPMLIENQPFEMSCIGAKTALYPLWSTSGIDLGLDQTNNEGCELTNGIGSASKSAWVVGQHDIMAQATISIADVSGTDDCAFGWRKAEAYQAAIDNYDEMACLNIISGSIKAETILNNAATSTSGTLASLADAGSVTLKVVVKKNGKCEFFIDGTQQNVNFSFDVGEVVVPFFYMLHDTDLAGAVNISSWKVGKL